MSSPPGIKGVMIHGFGKKVKKLINKKNLIKFNPLVILNMMLRNCTQMNECASELVGSQETTVAYPTSCEALLGIEQCYTVSYCQDFVWQLSL